jgi:hypothetical protein
MKDLLAVLLVLSRGVSLGKDRNGALHIVVETGGVHPICVPIDPEEDLSDWPTYSEVVKPFKGQESIVQSIIDKSLKNTMPGDDLLHLVQCEWFRGHGWKPIPNEEWRVMGVDDFMGQIDPGQVYRLGRLPMWAHPNNDSMPRKPWGVWSLKEIIDLKSKEVEDVVV